MVDQLRSYIKSLIVEEREGRGRGSSTISGQNYDDLTHAVTWARAHGVVQNVGQHKKTKEGRHSLVVKHSGSKNDFRALIKDRFGTFVKVD